MVPQPPGRETEDQFDAAVTPFRVALLDLVAQTRQLRSEVGYLPAADSRAMEEKTQESRFAGGWGVEPVTAAHSGGWLITGAAEDLIGSFCSLFQSGPTPVFGHTVLLRAAIESCARAAWLADPNIGVKLRVARWMSERLYSAREADQLPGARLQSRPRQVILEEARRQRFEKISDKRQAAVSLEERRKGNMAIVKWLFEQPSAGGDRELGEIVYRVSSAVAHSTLYGIFLQLEADASEPTRLLNSLTRYGYFTKSDQVTAAFRAVGIAYIQVGAFHRELFGWRSDSWERTVLNFPRLSRALRGG